MGTTTLKPFGCTRRTGLRIRCTPEKSAFRRCGIRQFDRPGRACGDGIPGERSPAILDLWRKAFATLDDLEGQLGNTRFLAENNATGADICLVSFVFYLDACYWEFFSLRHAPGYWGSILSVGGDAHYLNLRAFSREMYQLMETALDIASFKQNFRLVHAVEFACLPCSCKILSSHVRISHGTDIIARVVEAEVEKRWGEDPILTTTT